MDDAHRGLAHRCSYLGRVAYSSNPAARNFASSVFGVIPSFSAARVLFHLHSLMVFSSRAFSTCPAARLVTCSSVPSQLNFSGSIPVGNFAASGFRSEERRVGKEGRAGVLAGGL